MGALSLPGQFVDFIGDSMDNIRAKIKDSWDDMACIRGTLSRIVPDLSSNAHRHVDLLVELLGDGKATNS